MITRQKFPFFLSILVLIFGAMACAWLGSAPGIGGAQATATAAPPTDPNDNPTAGAIARSTRQAQATLNALATQAPLATQTAVVAATQTAAAAATQAPAAAATQTAAAEATLSGGPSDVPLIQGENTLILVSPQQVIYRTKADVHTVVSFYKDAMPKNGWTADAAFSDEQKFTAVMRFKKQSRSAVLAISNNSVSETTVAITIQ